MANAFTDFMKQDMAGYVEKAVIEVIDLRKREDIKEENGVGVKAKQTSMGGENFSYDMDTVTGAALSKGESLVAKSVDQLGLGGNRPENPLEKALNLTAENKKYFTVQFNPGTLSLSGHGGGLVQKIKYNTVKRPDDVKGDEDKKPPVSSEGVATFEKGDTYINLSVQLMFDACDPQDAFMGDKLNIAPSAAVTDVAKGISYGLGKKKTSVQKEVEGFIGALRNRYTRNVTFYWSDFNYSGRLKSVNANYVMFNPNGEPVRATVDLVITCADDVTDPLSLNDWRTKYANAFTKSESYVRNSQKVGNILNI